MHNIALAFKRNCWQIFSFSLRQLVDLSSCIVADGNASYIHCCGCSDGGTTADVPDAVVVAVAIAVAGICCRPKLKY